jgi:magnesium-protoporphyrin O-methyltransferase
LDSIEEAAMPDITPTYQTRRGEIEHYFDRTAMQAWEQLTSTAPVGKIRATVRAGRDRMRETLLSWLPGDLRGKRILDAGCGTGAFAMAAARRGAHVVAIDLSPSLVEVAVRRVAQNLDVFDNDGHIDFRSGDFTDQALGDFDHVVAMDSLIHYDAPDIARMLATLSPRCAGSMLITIAPRTVPLTLMHMVGRAFPRSDRAPAIEPVSPKALQRQMLRAPSLDGWHMARQNRISAGFYISHAIEITAPGASPFHPMGGTR